MRPKRRFRKTCVVHDWKEPQIRVASRKGGADGYRLPKKCAKCGTRSSGKFVKIDCAVKIEPDVIGANVWQALT